MAGPSKTSALQTSFNAAATVVAAELNAGIIKDQKDVADRLIALKDTIFGELSTTVDTEVGTQAVTSRSNGNGSAPRGGNFSVQDARDTVLNYGKFKGCTLGDVLLMDGKEGGGYGYVGKDGNGRPGVDWLKWAANNTDAKVAFIAQRAAAVLADAGVAA